MLLDVKIDNILPITEVKDSIDKLVNDVRDSDDMYVITKEGKPAAILVGVHHLEKLTGISHEEIMPDEEAEVKEVAPEVVATPATATVDSFMPVDQAPKTAEPTNQADDLFTNPVAYKDETELPADNVNAFGLGEQTSNSTPTDDFFAPPAASNTPATTASSMPVDSTNTFATPAADQASAIPTQSQPQQESETFLGFGNKTNSATGQTSNDDLFAPVDLPASNTQPAQSAPVAGQTAGSQDPYAVQQNNSQQ